MNQLKIDEEEHNMLELLSEAEKNVDFFKTLHNMT